MVKVTKRNMKKVSLFLFLAFAPTLAMAQTIQPIIIDISQPSQYQQPIVPFVSPVVAPTPAPTPNAPDSFFDVFVESVAPSVPVAPVNTSIQAPVVAPATQAVTPTNWSRNFTVGSGSTNYSDFMDSKKGRAGTNPTTTPPKPPGGRGPATGGGGLATSSPTSTPPRGPRSGREIGGGGSSTSSPTSTPRPGRELGEKVDSSKVGNSSFFDVFAGISSGSQRTPGTSITPNISSFFDIFTEMSVIGASGNCMSELVKARDAAVLVAQQTYFAKINDALVSRSEATQSAWALSSSFGRQQALKTAGTNYALAKTQALIKYRSEKNIIWQKYSSSKTSCLKSNSNVMIEDGSQSSIDDNP